MHAPPAPALPCLYYIHHDDKEDYNVRFPGTVWIRNGRFRLFGLAHHKPGCKVLFGWPLIHNRNIDIRDGHAYSEAAVWLMQASHKMSLLPLSFLQIHKYNLSLPQIHAAPATCICPLPLVPHLHLPPAALFR